MSSTPHGPAPPTDPGAPVLLVEDDPDVAEAVTIALEVFGVPSRRVANGQAALDMLVAGFRPSVILLDLMMPIMDGHEFRRNQLASTELAGIPVIVVTAQAVDERARAALRADGWLKKPVDIADLLRAVRQLRR